MYRPFNNYRINGEHGDPDIRKENRYCALPYGHERISTPSGIREGFGTATWVYGVGMAQPIYHNVNSLPCVRTKLDNTKYPIPHHVYAMDTRSVIVNNLESDFQPPIQTPEEAKLVQGELTKYSR